MTSNSLICRPPSADVGVLAAGLVVDRLGGLVDGVRDLVAVLVDGVRDRVLGLVEEAHLTHLPRRPTARRATSLHSLPATPRSRRAHPPRRARWGARSRARPGAAASRSCLPH